jgi:predicted Zn-dependent protease
MTSILKVFKQWWKTWGTLPVYSWVKAAALYRLGQYSTAKKYYEKGLKSNPSHPASNCARIDLAYCLFKLGKFEESERYLRNVTTNDPENREAYERLGKLHLWTGNYVEAAWNYRRGLQYFPEDLDFTFNFLFSVLGNGGPGYLLQEAKKSIEIIPNKKSEHIKYQLAVTLLTWYKGQKEEAENKLKELVTLESVPIEALISYAEILLEQGKITHARRYLRIALSKSSNHPRVLTLLADSYLQPGPFYNAVYARQLASTAAQNTAWLSPFAMHTLADAYYHEGDKMSALIMASKAKDVGNQRLGAYRGEKHLDLLIETLSSGTLA